MRTYTLRVCPSCGSNDAWDRQLCPHQHLRVCNRCGLVYAPEYGDPDDVYVDGYHSGLGPGVFEPAFQEFLAYVATSRFKIIEGVVRPPGQLLDVGCGAGEVLLVAAERGWQVQGVEPLAESAEVARGRGLDVRPTRLEDSGLPERTFDVVTAFHVLEHMSEGTAFLSTVARWVRPGGYLVVEVPNFRSFYRLLHDRGLSWPMLRPGEHVAHYSTRTLSATLRRAKVEPVLVTAPTYMFPSETLGQALDDLGLQRFQRVSRFLGGARRDSEGETIVPNLVGKALLPAVERIYRMTGTGMVSLAISRVP